MHIVYIHGFLSGPNAMKATLLKEYLAANHLQAKLSFSSLDFPDTPQEAYLSLCEQIKNLIALNKDEKIVLIGSSMGGFFSTLLSQQFNLNCILLNPCVHPQDYFVSLIGPQYNEATQRRFELKAHMLDYLLKLDSSINFDPQKILVILGAQDEVLDYKKSIDFYQGCKIHIVEHEDHAFSHDFISLIPLIIDHILSLN